MFEYKWPRPAYTSDVVVFRDWRGRIDVLLIDRAVEPFGMALPGGHANEYEQSIDCAVRELKEETGLTVAHANLKMVGVFDRQGRDPRGWVVTIAYSTIVHDDVLIIAGDDAKSYRWVPICDVYYGKRKLSFDHFDIVKAAYQQHRLNLGA